MTPPIDPPNDTSRDAVRSIAVQLSAPHTSMGLLAALRRFDPIT